MKSEIIEFYANLSLHIPKLIAKRPKNITSEQIEAAAEKVYSEIQNGYKIKTLNIARYVWQVAKGINADVYVQEQTILQNHVEIISNLKAEINKRDIEAENIAMETADYHLVVLLYAIIAAFLAVGNAISEVLCIL